MFVMSFFLTDPRPPESDTLSLHELFRSRFLPRQEHGVAQMRAARPVGKHSRQEFALRLFQPFLVAQREIRFGFQLLPPWQQPRLGFGGARAKLIDADEAAAAGGQLDVHCETVHPRDVLVRRSGSRRRDTRSLTHLTERLSRSPTIRSC